MKKGPSGIWRLLQFVHSSYGGSSSFQVWYLSGGHLDSFRSQGLIGTAMTCFPSRRKLDVGDSPVQSIPHGTPRQLRTSCRRGSVAWISLSETQKIDFADEVRQSEKTAPIRYVGLDSVCRSKPMLPRLIILRP